MAEGRVKANGGRKSMRQQFQLPNREGKGKRQWTVAMVQDEASGERAVATVQEEATRPTRPFGNYTKGLVVFSLTCWNGTLSRSKKRQRWPSDNVFNRYF